MPIIIWTDALAMGHAGMDADHRSLVDLLNRLQHPGEGQELRPTLAQIEAHVRGHFAREEQLMLDIGYPLAARHQKEHVYLFDELRARIADLDAGRLDTAAIAEFLGQWLFGHLEGADRPLAHALARRNARRAER